VAGVAACSSSSGTSAADSAGGGSAGGGSAGGGGSSGTHVITDTTGRKVTVPVSVTRVATIGTIPVMISYVIAVGAQDTIVTRGGQGGSDSIGANGKQGFQSTALYKIISPNVLTAPSVEDAINAPVDAETLVAARPQVVIAPNLSIAQPAVEAGIPVVILQSGATGPDVMQDVSVMGNLFGKQKVAAAYDAYFDNTVKQLQAGVAKIPAASRVTALFLAFSPLRAPVYSTNYMFPIIGATSVTASLKGTNVQITDEQLLAWNPDVIVVQQAVDKQALLTDPQFATLKAVRTKRVYLIPQSIQTWTDNSPLMPLGLLYLAKAFYPAQFGDIDLPAAVQSFFRQFCGVSLSSSQVNAILADLM
jgi:iron complex transport system substrate-binding protein